MSMQIQLQLLCVYSTQETLGINTLLMSSNTSLDKFTDPIVTECKPIVTAPSSCRCFVCALR